MSADLSFCDVRLVGRVVRAGGDTVAVAFAGSGGETVVDVRAPSGSPCREGDIVRVLGELRRVGTGLVVVPRAEDGFAVSGPPATSGAAPAEVPAPRPAPPTAPQRTTLRPPGVHLRPPARPVPPAAPQSAGRPVPAGLTPAPSAPRIPPVPAAPSTPRVPTQPRQPQPPQGASRSPAAPPAPPAAAKPAPFVRRSGMIGLARPDDDDPSNRPGGDVDDGDAPSFAPPGIGGPPARPGAVPSRAAPGGTGAVKPPRVGPDEIDSAIPF